MIKHIKLSLAISTKLNFLKLFHSVSVQNSNNFKFGIVFVGHHRKLLGSFLTTLYFLSLDNAIPFLAKHTKDFAQKRGNFFSPETNSQGPDVIMKISFLLNLAHNHICTKLQISSTLQK